MKRRTETAETDEVAKTPDGFDAANEMMSRAADAVHAARNEMMRVHGFTYGDSAGLNTLHVFAPSATKALCGKPRLDGVVEGDASWCYCKRCEAMIGPRVGIWLTEPEKRFWC